MKAEIKVRDAEKMFLAVARNMASEHSGYYSVNPFASAGMFIDGKMAIGRPIGSHGWDYKFDLVAEILKGIEDCFTVSWITSAGNTLTCHKNGIILVDGRRHGIPFWVLPEGWQDEVEYYRYESSAREDLAPWEKSSGQYCPMTAEEAFEVLSASEVEEGYPKYARKLKESVVGIDIEKYPYVGVAGPTHDGGIGLYFGDKISVNTYCQNR